MDITSREIYKKNYITDRENKCGTLKKKKKKSSGIVARSKDATKSHRGPRFFFILVGGGWGKYIDYGTYNALVIMYGETYRRQYKRDTARRRTLCLPLGCYDIII